MIETNNAKNITDFEDKSLLIVDDDNPFRERLARAMEKKGFMVTQAEGVKKGITSVNDKKPAFAVIDLRLNDGNGLEVVKEIQKVNPDSRRASMIYQRPSIWHEFKENGKNDFICTNAVTYYIRNERLHAVVQMRSNDVIFGYRNDYAWQKYVYNKLREDLYYNGLQTKEGNIFWQVQNLHVYEKHFDLVI